MTRNLNVAFLRLRFGDHTREFWAQQLCIDQAVPAKKSDQVGIMHCIYGWRTAGPTWLCEL